jgi:hypothetical protein
MIRLSLRYNRLTFQTSGKISDCLRGIYGICLKLMKKTESWQHVNQLDLETLEFRPKNLPWHSPRECGEGEFATHLSSNEILRQSATETQPGLCRGEKNKQLWVVINLFTPVILGPPISQLSNSNNQSWKKVICCVVDGVWSHSQPLIRFSITIIP